MSVEDRLLVLLNQARQSGGGAALSDPAIMRSQLSSQAPDLHGEIQALSAALAMGAAARVASAADPASERNAVAAEIAQRERLSMGVVQPALEVACLAGLGIGSPKPAAADGWAGDSIVVGAGGGAAPPPQPMPQPQPAFAGGHGFGPGPAMPPPLGYGDGGQPYPPVPDPYGPPGGAAATPFYKQTWFFAAVGAAIVVGAIGYTQSSSWRGGGYPPNGPQGPQYGAPQGPGQGQGPGPAQPGGGPGPAGGGGGELRTGGPELQPYGGALPALPIQASGNGTAGIGFRLTAQNGPIDGIVVLPAGGWDAGQSTLIGTMANGQQSIGTGRYQVGMSGNIPIRVMRVQWQQDGIGAGSTIVGFEGQPGQQDVQLSGAMMCLMDGNTAQPVGCGRVQ